MTEREKILGRIKEALSVPASRPGHGKAAKIIPAIEAAKKSLPAVGRSLEERTKQFAENAANLRAEFLLFNSPEAAVEHLLAMKQSENWKRVAAHSTERIKAACGRMQLPVCFTDNGYDTREMEGCDAGITECDALVAQTGSVLVTSRSAGGRALSVLPPHHVVFATRDQIVPDLPEAFALLHKRYHPAYPSFISFITGPSRTGDIERILVLGAHGPKKLTILCY